MARRKLTAGNPGHTVYWGYEKEGEQTSIQPPSVPYLMLLSTKLNGIAVNRYRSIIATVKKLKLDRASRIKRGEEHKEDTSDKQPIQGGADYRNLRDINKGLALELLMSYLMYQLISPASSRANCKLAFQWPCNVAPAGYSDLSVDYGKGCIAHVEVSARQGMDITEFYKQFKSTLNHMAEKDADWGLLVTEWDLKRVNEERYSYEGLVQRGDNNDKRRNIIIMSIQEMASLSQILSYVDQFQAGTKRFDAGKIPELFEALRAAQEKFGSKQRDKKTQETKPDAENQGDENQSVGESGKKKKGEKKPPENMCEVWIETTKRLLKSN